MGIYKYILLSSLVALSIFFFSPTKTFAANLHVRAGASGSTCTDWGANACPDIPAMSVITRGDVIYVADGVYGGATFDKPTSGSSVITIKKATASDHGTSSGWDNTYGDGQAQWGDIVFTTDYWIFDGVTGGGPGSWTSGHGFKFTRNNSGGSARMITLYHDLGVIHHIQIKHCEFVGVGAYATGVYGYSAISGYNASTYINDSVFSYNYMHNLEGLSFGFQGTTYRNIWEYNYSVNTCGAAVDVDKHCEDFVFWSANDSDFRYNYQTSCNFSGCSGSAVHNDSNNHANPMSADGMRFYGNIFVGPGKSIVCNGEGSIQTNAAVVQNTFINISGAGPNTGDCSFQGPTYNNIYMTSSPVYPFGGTHDYNIIQGPTLAQDDMHVGAHETLISLIGPPYFVPDSIWNPALYGDVAVTSAIFRNYSGTTPEDYRLVGHITDKAQYTTVQSAAGFNICTLLTCDSTHTYNKDMFGSTFGGDGTWDRGFAQYMAAVTPPTDTTPPSIPTSLSAGGVSTSAINLTWTASTDAVGVTGYKIYRGGTYIGTSGTASYADSGLSPNTSYTYTVSAYDAAGNTSSPSSSATATTQQAIAALPGDLNQDHIVNSLDWSLMQGVWLTSNSTADINHDSTVNSLDFSILSSTWLQIW